MSSQQPPKTKSKQVENKQGTLLSWVKPCTSDTEPGVVEETIRIKDILGDPGADSGGEGKSKRTGKCGAKKSKERREEPLGTMSYQTSSKRSPPFWLLIGARKTQVFWHQSEARTAATVWNWSGKTLSPGALLAVLYFSSCHIFRPFSLSLAPTTCPWVSEDESKNNPKAIFWQIFRERFPKQVLYFVKVNTNGN